MGKEETLLKLKAAEAEVRALKDAAERDREMIARDARRQALELRDQLRDRAEARYREILSEVSPKIESERAAILAVGEQEAKRMRSDGEAKVGEAVDAVLAKFKGALHA